MSLLFVVKSDTFITFDEQRINWFNSLIEGTFVDGANSTIIKQKYNGNITIKFNGDESWCMLEYDTSGRFVSHSSGGFISSNY